MSEPQPNAAPEPPKKAGPLPASPSLPNSSAQASLLPTASKTPPPSSLKKSKVPLMLLGCVLFGVLTWGSVKLFQHWTSVVDKSEKTKVGDTVAVNVMEAKLDHFSDTLLSNGTIGGGTEVPLRFEVEGIVTAFPFKEGDKVSRGAIIARLNPRDADLKLKKAQLELRSAEKLFTLGAITRQALEEKRLSYDLANSDLAKTQLRAPFDGILGNKDVDVGEFVTPSKKVAMLFNLDTVVIRLGVNEKQVDKVQVDQQVIAIVETYPGNEFHGRVINIDPRLDPNSHQMTITAEIDNEGGLLLPNMWARTTINIHDADGVLVVPNDAIDKTSGGDRVFVVTPDNKAEARPVVVEYKAAQFSVISQGLSPGDMVITQRPGELKEGAAVKVIEVVK